MEDTPHVMLAGAGAKQYARELRIDEVELLTDTSRRAWEEWRKTSDYKPVINIENHDTIGLLSHWMTKAVCRWMHHQWAGLQNAWSRRRSSILGAGLFVDAEIGGATAIDWVKR